MNNKKVSIIVPSYNHAKYVRTLIESIYRQTHKNFELLVLDDGSKDNSPEVLKKLQSEFGFELILKSNEGLCKTLNRGVDWATGEFVVIIASDDYMPDTRLEEQVQFFQQHPSVDVVGGASILMNESGEAFSKKIPRIQGNVAFEDEIRSNRVLAPTVMVRRSIYERFGKYRDDLPFEDFYMWLNILKNGGKIYNTDKFWAYYRIVNSDLEKKFTWYYRGFLTTLNAIGNSPAIIQSAKDYTFVFLTKLSLVKGRPAIVDYQKEYSEMKILYKTIVWFVAHSPEFIRHFLLRVLNLKSS